MGGHLAGGGGERQLYVDTLEANLARARLELDALRLELQTRTMRQLSESGKLSDTQALLHEREQRIEALQAEVFKCRMQLDRQRVYGHPAPGAVPAAPAPAVAAPPPRAPLQAVNPPAAAPPVAEDPKTSLLADAAPPGDAAETLGKRPRRIKHIAAPPAAENECKTQ